MNTRVMGTAARPVCRRRAERARRVPAPPWLRLTAAEVDLLILLGLASGHDGGPAEQALFERMGRFRTDARASDRGDRGRRRGHGEHRG